MNNNTTFDLNTPLLSFTSGDTVSHWTIREAVESCGIFGGVGAGKTSSSGAVLARKFLMHGFGGLVLCAKPELKLWEQYCKESGRLDDLIVVEPGGKHFFNFIEYESHNTINGATITSNIVQVLKTVIRAAEAKSGGRSDDPFWETALDMLIYNTIDLCVLAYGKISIQNLYDIAISAPKEHGSDDDEDSEDNEGKNNSAENKTDTAFTKAFTRAQYNISWLIGQYEETLTEAERADLLYCDSENYCKTLFAAVPDARRLQNIDQFFVESYRSLSSRTRSIIDFAFQGFLFQLLCEPVYTLLCNTKSTFKPEDSLDGKIILINIPVKTFNHLGRDCQVMMKYIWQRAMEKRDVDRNGRPVFLWADEAQHFLHEFDAEFQATSRAYRIATVYISQNLPNYYANMGGTKAEHKVKSFLGTLGTKIFHANACMDTNTYASALIGDGYIEDISNGSSMADTFSFSENSSWRLEKIVRPEEFVGLKNGSEDNGFKVEAYMHRQGRKFADGRNFKRVTFSQK